VERIAAKHVDWYGNICAPEDELSRDVEEESRLAFYHNKIMGTEVGQMGEVDEIPRHQRCGP
jgi:hypothetical protein